MVYDDGSMNFRIVY